MLVIERSVSGSWDVTIELVNWHELVHLHGTVAKRAFEDLMAPELQAWRIQPQDISICDNLWFVRLSSGSVFDGVEPLLVQAILEASLMASRVVIDGVGIPPIVRVNGGTRSPDRGGLAARVVTGWQDRGAQTRDLVAAAGLLDAIGQGRAHFAFQEIVDMGSGRTMYHEALLRMAGGGDAEAPSAPLAAICAVERVGLAFRLDYSVLRSVCDLLEAHPALRLGCNVSASSLAPSAWWELFLRKLDRQGDLASRLVIEITETAAIPDKEAACRLLVRLREAGCTIAIDDFGAGQTSMAFVMAVQPGIIKIDRSLLIAARDNEAYANYLKHMVAAFRSLQDCTVIAEGVETLIDCQIALAAGVGGGQGFLLHQPATRMPWAPHPCSLADAFRPLARKGLGRLPAFV
ncbi:MAG: EAL domain-containing protein [Comamonas sp.]